MREFYSLIAAVSILLASLAWAEYESGNLAEELDAGFAFSGEINETGESELSPIRTSLTHNACREVEGLNDHGWGCFENQVVQCKNGVLSIKTDCSERGQVCAVREGNNGNPPSCVDGGDTDSDLTVDAGSSNFDQQGQNPEEILEGGYTQSQLQSMCRDLNGASWACLEHDLMLDCRDERQARIEHCAVGYECVISFGTVYCVQSCNLEGESYCRDNFLVVCERGRWQTYDCEDELCLQNSEDSSFAYCGFPPPACEEGSRYCNDHSLVTCENGVEVSTPCDDEEICLDATADAPAHCAVPCFEGSTYCDGTSTLLTCENGAFVSSTCDWGCDDDAHAGNAFCLEEMSPDAAIPDAAIPDAEVVDAEVVDAEVVIPDAAVLDAEVVDAEVVIPDAAVLDAEVVIPDAAVLDAEVVIPDAAVLDAEVVIPDAAVLDAEVDAEVAIPDAAVLDAEVVIPDAAVWDAEVVIPDAAVLDADVVDAEVVIPDAAVVDAEVVIPDAAIVDAEVVDAAKSQFPYSDRGRGSGKWSNSRLTNPHSHDVNDVNDDAYGCSSMPGRSSGFLGLLPLFGLFALRRRR